ncbi:hypothetical protein I7I50_08486 [Histoplasma capsulatum G186AR]|uniref:Uncharacterized protein n=1 Tax=Ajellomyces capsulatus TaxID=5037 RepID=A0A8H7YTY0_AJECA|nr:hypothetical protein I7I52_06001 [Histoplasma capsulatum]QSS73631.1 hypothetical protein I7I50_08486 [Histoplasma capsulatum G186AR]
MYSLSSEAPSNHVIRSSLSTNTKFSTLSTTSSPFFPSLFRRSSMPSLTACALAIYSGIATSFFSQAKYILRRSMGIFPAATEMKRVGVESGMHCDMAGR